MIALISYYKCPPGEFYYIQTEGIYRKFASTPLIENLAKEVADFRKGNNLPRATKEEAWTDIEVFTCTRLKNSSKWCYDTEQPLVAPLAAPSVPIKSGAPVTASAARGCSTCGARVRR